MNVKNNYVFCSMWVGKEARPCSTPSQFTHWSRLKNIIQKLTSSKYIFNNYIKTLFIFLLVYLCLPQSSFMSKKVWTHDKSRLFGVNFRLILGRPSIIVNYKIEHTMDSLQTEGIYIQNWAYFPVKLSSLCISL